MTEKVRTTDKTIDLEYNDPRRLFRLWRELTGEDLFNETGEPEGRDEKMEGLKNE